MFKLFLLGSYPAHLEVWHDGRCVARHERCYSRRQQILDLEHYLDVLERKPGALAGSTALEQWRRAGRWPASFDALWQRLIERQGRQSGTRAMIAVIQLGKEFGHDAVRQAVDSALKLGCSDSAAIRYLLTCAGQQRPVLEVAEIGGLTRYDRPMPCLRGYDRLLDQDQEVVP